MKLQITISDENGKTSHYTLERSGEDEPKNLNDFILDALTISENKRKLPLKTICPNGLEVYPYIRMGIPMFGEPVKDMYITWR